MSHCLNFVNLHWGFIIVVIVSLSLCERIWLDDNELETSPRYSSALHNGSGA